MSTSRRDFLRAGAAVVGAASLYAAPMVIAGDGVKGANERIGVGFIGCGARSEAHTGVINDFAKQGIAEPVAVCDVYRPRVEAASKRTNGAKMYMEHEALLADPRVDVVCIATPDRHHVPIAIEAMNGGKDVYCEKPLTHWSQFELAKKIQQAAEKTGRIVQVGTQSLACDDIPELARLVREGVIGKPVHAVCGYFRRGEWGERREIPNPAPQPGPDLLWDRFLGDAPKVDYTPSRFFQWLLYWDYAGGPAPDLLVHSFAPIRRILDLGFPDRVMCGGGILEYDQWPREVPDHVNIVADYAGGPSVVMMSSLSNYVPNEHIIRGTEGVIKWPATQSKQSNTAERPVRIVRFEKGKEEIHLAGKGYSDTNKLWGNLLECVRTRQQPDSTVDNAVRVQAPISMSVMALRESKVARFDQAKQEIVLS